MTRTRVLSGMLLGLFVIVAIINLLLLKSGLTGNTSQTPTINPSPYFIETKNSL